MLVLFQYVSFYKLEHIVAKNTSFYSFDVNVAVELSGNNISRTEKELELRPRPRRYRPYVNDPVDEKVPDAGAPHAVPLRTSKEAMAERGRGGAGKKTKKTKKKSTDTQTTHRRVHQAIAPSFCPLVVYGNG